MQARATASTPVRVFLVEDSEPVRERLKEMIEVAGGAEAGHAAGVEAATRAILAARPEIVILDIQLADGTGFDVLRALQLQAPEIDVYLYSNHAADPYRQLAMRLGARDFFDKVSEFERMRDVIVSRCATRH